MWNKFFWRGKMFNQQQSPLPTNCKYSKHNVISHIEQALKRWKEYFYNISNPKETLSIFVSIIETLSDNYGVWWPKYNEICTTINQRKSNKAAGTGNIPPEFSNVGRTFKQKLYKLILKVWDKEQLPTQWNKGILYKIGETLKCDNYTPITLLNSAYKMFAILLNKRISDTVERSWKIVKWDFIQRNLLLTYLWLEKFVKSAMNIIFICIIYLITIHSI
jgi:hypothetical protein